ncbi:MAG: hypothetical protein WAM60_20550 [Candidatus Promineifilaceae bacterium]
MVKWANGTDTTLNLTTASAGINVGDETADFILIKSPFNARKYLMEFNVFGPLNRQVRKTIMYMFMAADPQTVPANARYLSALVREKMVVTQRLLQVLAQDYIFFESEFFEENFVTAKELFQAILKTNPDTAAIFILDDRKLRDTVVMMERILGLAVCHRYSNVLVHQLLHIEFLDEQILQLVEEIERENLFLTGRAYLPTS